METKTQNTAKIFSFFGNVWRECKSIQVTLDQYH